MDLKDQRGVTLIELAMVAVIMGILMLGIHNIFSSQDQSARANSLIAEMHQNLRVAQYWLTRDIRVAGYRLENQTTTSGLGPLNAITITDGGANPDQIDLLYAASDPSCTITNPMPDASSELNVTSTAGLTEGNLIIITDGNNTSLFEITEVQTAALKIQHNPASPYNDPGGHGTFPGYGTGSRLYLVVFHSYRIATVNGIPCLQCDFHNGGGWQTIAEYIEDLQVTPVANNSPNYTITVRARTSLQERTLPGDGYRRKTLTWSVRPRNIP